MPVSGLLAVATQRYRPTSCGVTRFRYRIDPLGWCRTPLRASRTLYSLVRSARTQTMFCKHKIRQCIMCLLVSKSVLVSVTFRVLYAREGSHQHPLKWKLDWPRNRHELCHFRKLTSCSTIQILYVLRRICYLFNLAVFSVCSFIFKKTVFLFVSYYILNRL
jgi:hypothetical protein